METIRVILENKPLVTQLIANVMFIVLTIIGVNSSNEEIQANAVQLASALFIILNLVGLIVGKYWSKKNGEQKMAAAKNDNAGENKAE